MLLAVLQTELVKFLAFLAIAPFAAFYIGWYWPRPTQQVEVRISLENAFLRFQIEHELRWTGIRKNRRAERGLRCDWQAFVIACSPFEFELFLITHIWPDAGQKLCQLRLERSKWRKEVEAVMAAETGVKMAFA